MATKRQTRVKKRRRAQRRERQPHFTDGPQFRAIRERMGSQWTQEVMARKLGVLQPVISAWEKGRAKPSARMCMKYANLPLDKSDIRWLFERAGAVSETIEQLADHVLQKRAEPAAVGETIRVPPLASAEAAGRHLIFPTWLAPHPLATRYLRVEGDFDKPELRDGDVFLIDSSDTDVRTMSEGSFLAASFPQKQKEKSPISFGWLQKKEVEHDGFPVTHFYLRSLGFLQGAPLMLGFAVAEKPMTDMLPGHGARVLGRVIAWIPAPGEKDPAQKV